MVTPATELVGDTATKLRQLSKTMTQSEAARQLGISRERARQIARRDGFAFAPYQPMPPPPRRRIFSAKQIKRLREKAGMTQQQFASLMSCSLLTIARWEAGSFTPCLRYAQRLEQLQEEPGKALEKLERVCQLATSGEFALLRVDNRYMIVDRNTQEPTFTSEPCGIRDFPRSPRGRWDWGDVRGRSWQPLIAKVREAGCSLTREPAGGDDVRRATKPHFGLRFRPAQVRSLAAKYDQHYDDEIIGDVSPRIRRQGYIGKNDLMALSWWKTRGRNVGLCEHNDAAFVEAVTRTALSNQNERLRIEVLTLLDGVSWPMASVLLHFGARDPYPILDYRALWSVGVEVPGRYDFDFWWAYTTFCRDLAGRASVDMRTLDRALWHYYENRR